MGAAIHASFSVPLLIGGPLLPFLDIHRPVQYPLRACNEQAATLDDSFSPAELYISIDDTPAGFSLAEATIIPCSRETRRILPPCTPKSCKHGCQDNVSCLERETDLSVWSRRKHLTQENRVWSHQWGSNCCRSRLRFDAANIYFHAWAAVTDVGLMIAPPRTLQSFDLDPTGLCHPVKSVLCIPTLMGSVSTDTPLHLGNR